MTRPRSAPLFPVLCHLCGDEVPRSGLRGRPFEYCGRPCTHQLAKSPAARELFARMRARIDELEEVLDTEIEVDGAAASLRLVHEAGPKGDLGIAVRKVATACGRDETRDALLRVVSVARSWARNLMREGDDRIGERAA